MRRILLMLPLALVAFALAPVAAASAANTVSGECTVSGSASFTPNGLQGTPQTLGYNFSGTGTCSGTLNGTPITNAPVSANASGSGTLSCAGAVSTGGTGSIAFTGQGVTVGFGIDLVGTGSEVEFVLTGNGGGAGVGHATFATNGARAIECANPSGLNNLGFEIQAAAANLTG
jgi:hypothetical protein